MPSSAWDEWTAFLTEPTVRTLQGFHARHKMELIARDEAAARTMGRVCAEVKVDTLQAALVEYGALLKGALEREPSRGAHANALSHLVGHVYHRPTARRLAERVEAFRVGDAEFVDVLAELRTRLVQEDADWAASQSYFDAWA